MFKLSICQPTYNRVYFIKDTTTKIIEQILSEKRENDVQLCFSDNGSTDGTKDIIEEMKRKYPTINFKVNAARKSKVDDNTARMQSIKQLGV